MSDSCVVATLDISNVYENFPKISFGLPSRFAWYNLYVYRTARSSWSDVGPVLKMSLHLDIDNPESSNLYTASTLKCLMRLGLVYLTTR